MCGIVNRVKVRVRGGGADGAGYELCEIKEVKEAGQNQVQPVSLSSAPLEPMKKSDLFFCDFREPRLADPTRFLFLRHCAYLIDILRIIFLFILVLLPP